MNRSWVHLILIGIDDIGSIILFGQAGITISSLCWIAMAGQDAPLKLWKWQRALLLWLGARLGHDHCDQARLADYERSQAVSALLKPP